MPHSPYAHLPARPQIRIAFTRSNARALYASANDALLQPATPLSAGIDLRACLDTPHVTVPAGGRVTVPTGVSVQPATDGIAGFLYSRSGLGAREGLTVAQGTGVIDPDYTGEILVVLLNTSGQERRITHGDRVAQLIFQPYFRPVWQETTLLDATERGHGGFGHTGQ